MRWKGRKVILPPYKAQEHYSSAPLDLPNGGRGEYRKIANYLRMSSVLVSLIFKGSRELSLEHACELSQYLQHSQHETRYFLLLVQYSRAGNTLLKEHLKKEIGQIQDALQNLRNSLPNQKSLSETSKAVYYSDWKYAAIRLATSLSSGQKASQIAQILNLDEKAVVEALEFLVREELCKRNGERFGMAIQHLHLPKDSPFIRQRQVAWRLKGFEKMDKSDPGDFFFTGPVTISRKDFLRISGDFREAVQAAMKRVNDSPPEMIACINVDWFQLS